MKLSIAIAGMLCMSSCVCSTHGVRREHIDRRVNIAIMDKSVIRDDMPLIQAHYNKKTRTITVPWDGVDDKGNPKPNFYLLGHELWHLPELGGSYHGPY